MQKKNDIVHVMKLKIEQMTMVLYAYMYFKA